VYTQHVVDLSELASSQEWSLRSRASGDRDGATSNMDVISQCQFCFDFKLPSTLWSNRVKTFDVKYATCGGSFVDYGTSVK